MGVCISSPENIIFMHHKIEAAYDRQEWCLLVQPDGSMQVIHVICIITKALLDLSPSMLCFALLQVGSFGLIWLGA